MTIIDHPYACVLAWFVINVALGFYMGLRFYTWRLKRLLTRIELLKLEVRR